MSFVAVKLSVVEPSSTTVLARSCCLSILALEMTSKLLTVVPIFNFRTLSSCVVTTSIHPLIYEERMSLAELLQLFAHDEHQQLLTDPMALYSL